jgi:hypothetical protein
VTEFGRNRDLVLKELTYLGSRRDVVLSTNVPLTQDGVPYAQRATNLQDPGVAVYWMRDGKPQVIACDRWLGVGENARAIWYALDALRTLKRCGASQIIERAYEGFAALPASAERPWREVLFGVTDPAFQASLVMVEAAFIELAKIHHPDRQGGSTATFAKISAARDAARKELGDG